MTIPIAWLIDTNVVSEMMRRQPESWLKREARHVGVSMEEFVRRLIREQPDRTKTERRPKPSKAFARHFGVEHGVDLPSPPRYGYRPVSFSGQGVG